MKKGKLSTKICASIVAILLLLGLTACFAGSAIIKPDTDDFYFEFGKKMNLPDTTVFNDKGEPIAYDAVCVSMIAPDGSEVDVSTGFVTPMQVGTYVLTYESASRNAKAEIEVECKDTIAPSLKMTVPEAYLIKETYEDTEFTVFTLPVISADDIAGIDVDRTVVSVTVGDTEIAMDGDKFTIPEEGNMVFAVTVYDLNGLSTTITRESIAVAPERFAENQLSSFAKDSYLANICGGWLSSWYTASILESDTDPSGKTMEGVLKITYDTTDTEAGACIHLARPIKRTDVQSIEVTFRVENGKVASGNIDAVIYKGSYRQGYWSVLNESILNGGNYVTYSIRPVVLDTMTGEDGYIREIQIETFGDGKIARSLYIADISYTPVGAPPKPTALTIGAPTIETTGRNTIYLPINIEHGAALYGNLKGACNEETHILINDQAWNDAQELCAFQGKVFYIGKIGAEKGTKITFKAGFTMTINGVDYVTETDYNYWWSGSRWVTTEVTPDPVEPSDPNEPKTETMVIGWPKNFSTQNTVYLWVDKDHGVDLYGDMTGVCNEETHILLNDQPWSGAQELLAFENYQWLSIGKIGGDVGTKLTIKAGFTITANGNSYVTAEDYNIWWDGGKWVETEVNANPTTEVITVGWPKTFSTKDTVYLWIDKKHDVALWGNMANSCNEETHILINDQPWSTQEIIAFENYQWFYIGKIGGTVGTKVTIKAGFRIIANGVWYVTAEDYTIWWNGTSWVETEVKP